MVKPSFDLYHAWVFSITDYPITIVDILSQSLYYDEQYMVDSVQTGFFTASIMQKFSLCLLVMSADNHCNTVWTQIRPHTLLFDSEGITEIILKKRKQF